MATMLEYSTVEQRSFVPFVARGLSVKDINKEIFPVYVGKCLSRKAVHNWATNVSMMTKTMKRKCGSG
jgi:hypothetical protein